MVKCSMISELSLMVKICVSQFGHWDGGTSDNMSEARKDEMEAKMEGVSTSP